MTNRGVLGALAVVLGLGVVGGVASAAEHKLKGVMFGDYYYVASGADKKQNGFEIRRIYLTYDFKWDDAFSGRVRLEAKDAGFGSTAKMEPFVKHAYVRYRKAGTSVHGGLSGTPTWNVSERVWGYRAVSKTIMDLHKIGSSADLGVSVHGKVDDAGRLDYQVMLGNGPGQSSEVDNDKKLYGLLHLKPAGAVEATAYADWEGQPAGRDRITLAGFVGMTGDRFHGGLEAFQRTNRNAAGGDDVQVRGLSAFGAGAIGERSKAFGRVDVFDPSDRTGDDREYRMVGGVDIEPRPDIHLMPNVVVTAFQDGNTDAEVVPRLTLYVKF